MAEIGRTPSIIDIPDRVDDQGRLVAAGGRFINPGKLAEKLWIATLDSDNITLVAGEIRSFALEAPPEENQYGHFEAYHLIGAVGSGNIRCRIHHLGFDKDFSSHRVHHTAFFGNNQYPFILPSTFWIEAGGWAMVELENLSTVASATGIRVYAVGRRFLGYGQPGTVEKSELLHYMAQQRSHPYWLSSTASPFTLTASSTGNEILLQVPGEADFECHGIVSSQTSTWSMQVYEGRGGAPLFPRVLPSSLITGTAQLPFLLSQPHLFARKTQIRCVFDETSGADNTVYFYLIGRLLYHDRIGARSVRTIGQPLVIRPLMTGA